MVRLACLKSLELSHGIAANMQNTFLDFCDMQMVHCASRRAQSAPCLKASRRQRKRIANSVEAANWWHLQLASTTTATTASTTTASTTTASMTTASTTTASTTTAFTATSSTTTASMTTASMTTASTAAAKIAKIAGKRGKHSVLVLPGVWTKWKRKERKKHSGEDDDAVLAAATHEVREAEHEKWLEEFGKDYVFSDDDWDSDSSDGAADCRQQMPQMPSAKWCTPPPPPPMDPFLMINGSWRYTFVPMDPPFAMLQP